MLKIIKFIFCILILFFVSHLFWMKAQNDNWKRVYETGAETYDSFHCLKCADSMNCMFLNYYGGKNHCIIIKTSDGGINWVGIRDTAYISNPSYYNLIHELSYPNNKLIVGIGDSGLVIRSTDNGETWEKYNLGKEKNLNVIAMYDENFGYLEGLYYNTIDSAFVLKTTDGGITWSPLVKYIPVAYLSFLDKNLLYGIYIILNKIFKYDIIFINNEWESCDTIPCPANTMYANFVDRNNGWAYLGKQILDSAGWTKWSQIIYGTKDGGLTWQKQRDTAVFNGSPIEDLRFYDKNFGIATSFLGQALITTDGGKNWREEIIDSFPKNDGHSYYTSDIQFLSSTQALVLCDYGFVYKYTREPTEVAEEPQFKPCNVTLFNNEDENELLLKLECPQRGDVNYYLYDLLGNIILNGNFIKNNFSMTIPVQTKLIPGVYFIKAIMDDNTLYYNKFYIIK